MGICQIDRLDIFHSYQSLRTLVVGGSAVPRARIEGYEVELGVNVIQAWGMTELSPLGTASIPLGKHAQLSDSERWDIKAKQGYVVSGLELRIVDLNNRELPWDGKSMGELHVRGPWVVSQYFKREITSEHFTEDGWFRTGDVSTIDEDGFMTITDRNKDLIKSGGEWISSAELENVLMAHPKVMEAAVIAVPDERWAERPLAVVAPIEDGEDITAEELKAFLAERVVKFWIPDEIVFVEQLLKTSVGKFGKATLRQMVAQGDLPIAVR